MFGVLRTAEPVYGRSDFSGITPEISPTSVPVLNAEAILGAWFTQSHSAPCSWQGSSQFTDWQFIMAAGEQPGIQYSIDAWRMHGVCTQVTFPLVASKTVPGKFIIKDPIVRSQFVHDVLGCTKPSVIPNQCADPWLDIVTRDKYPLPTVWNNIDMSLMHAFGLRLADMPRVTHTKSPCVPSIPYGVNE